MYDVQKLKHQDSDSRWFDGLSLTFDHARFCSAGLNLDCIRERRDPLGAHGLFGRWMPLPPDLWRWSPDNNRSGIHSDADRPILCSDYRVNPKDLDRTYGRQYVQTPPRWLPSPDPNPNGDRDRHTRRDKQKDTRLLYEGWQKQIEGLQKQFLSHKCMPVACRLHNGEGPKSVKV